MVNQSRESPRPVVYVSTSRKEMEVPPYGRHEADSSLTDYIRRVQVAGAIALQIPRDALDRIPEILAGADALVIVGGADVDPSFYGQENTASGATDVVADAFDLALIKEAKRNVLPVFAICRGHQLLNVAMGGTLHQDIPMEPVRHNVSPADADGTFKQVFHPIDILEDSKYVGRVFGAQTNVNSLHHQAIDQCAPGFRVVARSSDDVIEAIEPIDGDWLALSVQWHPEKIDDNQVLFDWFVEQVSNRLGA